MRPLPLLVLGALALGCGGPQAGAGASAGTPELGVRVSGSRTVKPDEAAANEMVRHGVDRLEALIRICVDETGQVTETELKQSSGIVEYDEQVRATVETWVYAESRHPRRCGPILFRFGKY